MKKFAFNLLLAASALLFTSGCATSALWDEARFARFHEPATPSNLALFQSPDGAKALAVYTEETDVDESLRWRAFWIDPASEPPDNPFRPPFVALKTTNNLSAISVGNAVSPSGYTAILTNDTHAFILFRDGRELRRYELPNYWDSTGRAKQVALTPLAVVADLTIVGGYIFLYAWSQGGFSGTL